MEAIVTLQFNGTDVTVGKLFTSIRRGIESAHFTYDTAYMRSSNAVSLCPEMPLSPGTFPAEHNAMHRIFQDCMPDRWAGTSCFVQNIKMLVRSIAQHAHYLREISCYPSTMRPDKAHCASGTTTVTR